jgi:metal-responsive CopG/Arc/MetJ family transcriptional regulator
MVKRVIQVPIEEELLNALDHMSKKKRKARADLIRQACRRYLQQAEYEELDVLYQKGYERTPEEAGCGEVQVALLGHVLPKESW